MGDRKGAGRPCGGGGDEILQLRIRPMRFFGFLCCREGQALPYGGSGEGLRAGMRSKKPDGIFLDFKGGQS